MVVTVLFKPKDRLPEWMAEVHKRCQRLKTFGVGITKVTVTLDESRAGCRAQINIRGRGLQLNASERRFLQPAQVLNSVLQKMERQLAKISSKRSKKRPLLARAAKLSRLNSSLEFEPEKAIRRRQVKAA